jgi:hypothetical protein
VRYNAAVHKKKSHSTPEPQVKTMDPMNLHALSRRLNSTHRLLRLVGDARPRPADRRAAEGNPLHGSRRD